MSFVPRNHPQQVAAQGALDEVDDRRTPADLFEPLHAEHGFTLDVAASAANAKCARYFSVDVDGLAQSWAGETVWCNPPYSSLYAWTLKALLEVAWGRCPKVVMLLPANRTEQAWWQDLIEPIRDRGFGVRTKNLRGRTRFEGPDGALKPKKSTSPKSHGGGVRPPFGCVLVVIEPPGDRSAKATNQ